MNNNHYWLFYIFWSSFIFVVSSAHVTALKEKVSGLSNSSIDLRWHIIHHSNQRIAVLNLYVLPDVKNSVLSALMPALQPRGAALFENRLSAKLVNGTYTAVLRNVGQNDRCFFQLQAVFMNPLESQTAIVQISVVEKLPSPMPPEETSTKPVMTQTKVVPSLGTTMGTKGFNTCDCDNKGGIIIGVIVAAVVMQILILAICLAFMKQRGVLCKSKQEQSVDSNDQNPTISHIAEQGSSHYTDLSLENIKPNLYADLAHKSDNSRQYADIN